MIAAGSIRSTSASAGICRQQVLGQQRPHAVPRHGDDHAVERLSRAVGQNQLAGTSAVAFDRAGPACRDAPRRRDRPATCPGGRERSRPAAAAAAPASLAPREARKPSRKTLRAAASDARSTVSPKALTSTTDQNRSIAAVRLPLAAEPRADGPCLVGRIAGS